MNNWTAWNYTVSGGIVVSCWVIGLFFFRFRKKSGDRFFAFFGCAFWLLAVERLLLVIFWPNDEMKVYVYSIRLVAFLFILYAIYDKNRARSDRKTGDIPPIGKSGMR